MTSAFLRKDQGAVGPLSSLVHMLNIIINVFALFYIIFNRMGLHFFVGDAYSPIDLLDCSCSIIVGLSK